jgi:hypothetical protein
MTVSLTSTGITYTGGAATSNGSKIIDYANWNTVSSGGSTTLTVGNRYFVTSAAQTVTLPATPAVGDLVVIGVPSAVVNTVVGRNGQPIMSLAQDMTIDIGNVSVTLEYVDATFGWRII